MKIRQVTIREIAENDGISVDLCHTFFIDVLDIAAAKFVSNCLFRSKQLSYEYRSGGVECCQQASKFSRYVNE